MTAPTWRKVGGTAAGRKPIQTKRLILLALPTGRGAAKKQGYSAGRLGSAKARPCGPSYRGRGRGAGAAVRLATGMTSAHRATQSPHFALLNSTRRVVSPHCASPGTQVATTYCPHRLSQAGWRQQGRRADGLVRQRGRPRTRARFRGALPCRPTPIPIYREPDDAADMTNIHTGALDRHGTRLGYQARLGRG